MTKEEFASWVEFYRQNPFDDFHRFQRPAALVAASNGADMRTALIELQKRVAPPVDEPPPPEPTPGRYSDADLRTMRALGLKV